MQEVYACVGRGVRVAHARNITLSVDILFCDSIWESFLHIIGLAMKRLHPLNFDSVYYINLGLRLQNCSPSSDLI